MILYSAGLICMCTQTTTHTHKHARAPACRLFYHITYNERCRWTSKGFRISMLQSYRAQTLDEVELYVCVCVYVFMLVRRRNIYEI